MPPMRPLAWPLPLPLPLLTRKLSTLNMHACVPAQGMSSTEDEDEEAGDGASPNNAPFGAFLKTFGAVPVSGNNMYK